ncbi:hypothetical protein K4F52_010293 [Lecanicillium sp. MT-2017a]|nr:hypothetical protein K4F52_010293 [Lecanicillium sp. MT-2017a]
MESDSAGRRHHLAGFKIQLEQWAELIEELMDKVDSKDGQIKKLQLDNENEGNARRGLQLEVERMQREVERQKCPFAMLLIDADGYLFRTELLNKATGGEDAADALNDAMQQWMEQLGLGNDVVVHVKAFANVGGLGTALKARGMVNDLNQLRHFAARFSSRKALFDFVDVGNGKEKADHKLRGKLPASASCVPL